MEVGFYLFFIIIMLLVLLNDWLWIREYTNLGESTIPIILSTGIEYLPPRYVIYYFHQKT
jgi:hypothetical protein